MVEQFDDFWFFELRFEKRLYGEVKMLIDSVPFTPLTMIPPNHSDRVHCESTNPLHEMSDCVAVLFLHI